MRIKNCPKCGNILFISAVDSKGRTSAMDCKFCGYYAELKNYGKE